jgi:hypothetical protein
MTRDEGGKAFPCELGYGMTLRDYFAAKAMQALLSDPSWREDMNAQETAYASYAQAREMLKARDQ